MKQIADLFGGYHLEKENGKVLNERASIIEYFSKEIGRTPQVMNIRLAHYTIQLLYSLKSQYTDRKRTNKTTALKWFWWVTKTK